MAGKGRVKLDKTIKIENGIYAVIGTNPIKEFTIPGVRSELKMVYGVDVLHSVVWKIVKGLEKLGLVSMISTVTKVNHYSIVSGTKVSDLIDQKVGFPKPAEVAPTAPIVEEKIISKIVDQPFDPKDFVSEDNYNRIINRLFTYNLEESKEMVIVVLAIMGHCSTENTTTFTSRSIFIMLNFLSKMTIINKLQALANAKCIVRPEETEKGVGYRTNVKPVDFGLNITSDGVLKQLISPADKVSGTTFTHEEVGDGIIAILKRGEKEYLDLLIQFDKLVKENAQLQSDNNEYQEKLRQVSKEVVSLTSTNEKLVEASKDKGSKSEITLRNMSDLRHVKVGQKKIGM